MAETVVIDIEAQYRDKTSEELEKSLEEIERLKKKLAETEAAGEKVNTTMDKFGPAKGVKNSTTELERMRKKLQETESAGKKANASIEKIASTASSVAKKTISIPIKVIDYATKPLRGILNFATSIRGVMTGLLLGRAGQTAIGNPLGLADQYSSAFIGFQTLFKSEERAQQMMNDLDEFARTTPYKTSNVIAQTQKMLAMGWDANRLIPDMTIIGDAAAATGKGDEGLQRIVLALAQIKSKGKLSTEELNQLAEAGISAKAYIAEGLGYGSDDAGLQKMSKDLEGGKIGGNAAVEMLLAGMKNDYEGMMDQMSRETVEGIMSNIEDTFEINIFRKWGQGLQEGAKIGLGSLADMLDESQERLAEVGDQLHDIGSYLSQQFAGYVQDSLDKTMDIMNSTEFRKASLTGKGKMLWNAIIAEPFGEWWESDGQKFIGNVAEKIGTGIGKFYGGAITTLLGINVDGAAESGLSIGSKFASGFLEGFDAKSVWEAILGSFGNALKIIPGGEKATSTSWLSAALLGYGGLKAAGAAGPILGGFKGIGSSAIGALLNSESLGMTAINLGAGNLSATSSLSVGALSAIGGGSLAGGLIGGAGIVSGMADLTRALNVASSNKEKDVAGWSAASKFGMVGTGAAAGAAIGSFFPVLGTAAGALIGAGAGGIAALFGGSKFGEAVSDYLDGTDKIKAATANIKAAGDNLESANSKSASLESLASKYSQLTSKIESGSLNTDEMADAQASLIETVKELQSLYPNLISQYDLENGKLAEKLSLIQDITEEQRKQSRRDAQVAVYEGEKQLPDLEKKIQGAQNRQNSALAQYDSLYAEAATLSDIKSGYYAQEQARRLYGADSDQFKALEAENQSKLDAYNKKYDQALPSGVYAVSRYDSLMKQAAIALEKANSEGEDLDSLLGQYQEIYQGKLQLALNPEGLDDAGGLNAMLEKIAEIQAIQQERLNLEKSIAELEKGSEEYDATAKAIQDAKDQQKKLTDSIEPFKDELQDVLDTVNEINTQFSLLGGMRFDLDEMGLTGLNKYLNPQSGNKAGYNPLLTKEATETASGFQKWTPLGVVGNKIPGFASGTSNAPPGLAWVGENGPELMWMRGGERIYDSKTSIRMATKAEIDRTKLAYPQKKQESKSDYGFDKALNIAGIGYSQPNYKGYASGTTSALPGLAWVGENGPELIRTRERDRISDSDTSMRIAAQTASSREGGAGAGAGAGGIHVSLGGMSITIAGGSSSGDIIEQLKSRLPELSNELCRMISTQLAQAYANMPTSVEGI